jgi:replicative DNA helicase
LGEIGRSLKLAALDMGIPIVLLSQVGRSAEKRQGGAMRPQLSDLKDSGTLEENADTVMSIFRAELYQKDKDEFKGKADIDILKQRNGECGRVPLSFVGKYIRFESVTGTNEIEYPEEREAREMPPQAPLASDW